MRKKSAIRVAIVLALTGVLAVIALTGTSVGTSKYRIKPLFDAISQGLDLRGGIYAVYEATDPNEPDLAKKMDQTIASLRGRLTGKGFTEATITKQGTNRIRVEIPDVDDPEQILRIVGQPAVLEFREPDGTVIMDGGSIKSADPGYNQDSAQWGVNFTLDSEGTEKFAEATARLVGQAISIYMDNELKSSPTVNSAIPSGEGVITAGSQQDAEDMATLIQSGSLPMHITQIEVRTTSATLGEDALEKSLRAGAIGFACILLFMMLYYRAPGIMASLALCIYLILDFFLLAIIPGVQLTLPGIAGIILSIGMAVDANVIIFERMKDELRAGKGIRTSVESGFRNALSAIVDSNVTTLIAGFVLLAFGTGSIRGFAMTLIIGVITSMITAVFITRFLLRQLVNLTQKKSHYGISEGEHRKRNLKPFDNLKRNIILPAAVIVLGLVVGGVTGGLNMGIDFTGGTLITIDMKKDFELNDIEAFLSEAGVQDVTLSKSGTGSGQETMAIVRMRSEDEAKEEEIRSTLVESLQDKYPGAAAISSERVGAVTGQDLIRNAFLSLGIAAVLMAIYIWIRFEWRQGVVAVGGLLLDVVVVVAVMMLCRNFVQINSSFIAAILTVVGYDINNTIVVFDRVRENRKLTAVKGITRGEIVNRSINESFTRTVNSSFTTLLTIFLVFALGVTSIREFALPIIIGILSGLFTSTMISAPVWALWADKVQQKSDKGKTGKANKKKKA